MIRILVAATAAGEIGDVGCFESVRRPMTYAGLVPSDAATAIACDL